MNYKLPHTIENCIGEKIIFKDIIKEADGDKLIAEGIVKPLCGPPMHTHFKQDECMTVKKRKNGLPAFG